MKKFVSGALFLSLFSLLLLFPLASESEAIPAFARVHKVACSFCHVGFPKLNSVGINFKQNGYRMPGTPGTYLWEKPIPLAARINFALPAYSRRNWNLIGPGAGQVPPGGAFGAPGEVRADSKETAFKIVNWQLLAGGTLAPKVSFLFQVVGTVDGLNSADQGFPAPGGPGNPGNDLAPSSTSFDTEVMVGQIDDLLPNAQLNLRIGKDHVDNLFLSRPRRLTLAPYTLMFQPITGGSLHANVVGVELNGLYESGLWYALGVRNLSPRLNSDDNQEVRPGAFYFTMNYPILEGQTLGLMFSSDKIGNENSGAPGPPNFLGTEDRTYGAGASLDLNFGDFNLIPALYYYVEGKNIHGGNDLNVYSGTLELHYFFTTTLIGTTRWDFLNVFDQPTGVFEDNINQFVVSLAWFFHPNVRVVAEYSYLKAELNRMTTLPFDNKLFTSVPGQFAPNTRADLEANTITLALEFDF
jgi:hypothetical protein